MGTNFMAVILSLPFAVATALCGIAAAAALLLSKKRGRKLPIKRTTALIAILALAIAYFPFRLALPLFF